MSTVADLAQRIQGLGASSRQALLAQLQHSGDWLGFSQIGQAGMTQLADALKLLAGSLSGHSFENVSHATQHLVGLLLIRVAQPTLVPQERFESALRILGQLHLCPSLDEKKVPVGIYFHSLVDFLHDLTSGKIIGLIFEPGQKEALLTMGEYLAGCQVEEGGFELVGEIILPTVIVEGEKALHQLYARHISLAGIMQRAVRLANPRLDSIALALALMKNLYQFSEANLAVIRRSQDAAAFLLTSESLTLAIGKEDLTSSWRAFLQKLVEMPLERPYPFAKVQNPFKREEVDAMEQLFERVATLNEGALSTAQRRVRSTVIEIMTVCLGLFVEALAELPMRLTVAMVKFYLTLPLRVAAAIYNSLIFN